jgi:hypothetical protein
VDQVLEIPVQVSGGPESTAARVRLVEAVADEGATGEEWAAVRADLAGRYGGFRRAPLVRVVDSDRGRLLLVGAWMVWLVDGELELVASVTSCYVESEEWQRVAVDDELGPQIELVPFRPRYSLPDADPQRLLATVAKALAEESRGTIAPLRSIRYGLEERVRASLGDDGDESPSQALPALIGLRLAVSQARDEVRECIREGFMVWRDDDEAHHRYRRHRDATILSEHLPADVTTRPWMRTHDAGIRQCEAMSDHLGEEIEFLSGMLDSAGTMATVREAEAADTLNKVASAVALGLGLPSLVIAYYGADRLFDLSVRATAASIALLLFPAMVAALIVRDHLPGSTRRVRNVVAALAIVALLVLLLLVVAFTKLGVPEA